MSKRMTETTIWDEDWFVKLPPVYQLFWFYIKDKCNHAGIWKPNTENFNRITGSEIELSDALNVFNKDKERIRILNSMRWFIVGFFDYQYGKTINLKNKVHKSVYDIYIEEGVLITNELKEGVKDKDKEKDKEKDIMY